MRLPRTALLAGLLLAGCGGGATPFEPPDPPRAGFWPPAGEIRLSPQDAVRFRATTPDGGPLVAEWVRDGERVALSSSYDPGYPGTGEFMLFASASFAERPLTAGWRVHVDPAATPLPVPVAIVARPAGVGEIEATVEPAPGVPPGTRYELFHDAGPFGPDELPSTPSVLVEGGAPTLLAGLVAAASYQLRARSVLASGRLGPLSGATELVAGFEPLPDLGVVTRPGTAAGQLVVEWDQVDDGIAVGYRVGWSREPITATTWPHVGQADVAHVPGEAGASLTLEGLLPGTLYWVALRIVQAGGGLGRPTETVAGVAAAIDDGEGYRLEGRLTGLSSRVSGARPLAGVEMPLRLAAGGTVRVTTGPDGRFAHEAASPVLLPDPLELPGHYPSSWRYLGEAGIEAVLLAVDTVDPAHAYPPDNPDFLNFYRQFVAGWGDTRRFRWESWPVEVQLFDFTHTGNTGEEVDYRRAMASAIFAWNEALGQEVFVPVEVAPARGVVWSVDQPASSPNLAETTFELPANSWFDEAAPERIRIRYKPLNFQSLLDRIALHELGHVLGLGHAPPVGLLMSVGAPGSAVHEDELRAVRLLQQLPQGFRAGRWAP